MSHDDDSSASEGKAEPAPARRAVLMLGAVAASSVVTIRPAIAATAASVLNCRIPLPDPPHAGQWIDAEGRLVPANTRGAVAGPPGGVVTGEQAKHMMQGLTPPGMDPTARQNYVRYIQRLQRGTSGFTCYASLQAPRR